MIPTIGMLIAAYVIFRSFDIAFTHINRKYPNSLLSVIAAVLMPVIAMYMIFYAVTTYIYFLHS
jgi:hypothetical protein